MRLLTVLENVELTLVERVGNDIPPYAILSHTWGNDSDEISYKDFIDGRYQDKKGFHKLQFCQQRVALDNLEYFWVDTCCIDKSSSAELTEAINSMYRWYQGAARCYVFLSDVDIVRSHSLSPRRALRNSRWFRRGWTLQELIAPTYVDFFDSNGIHLGDKHSLFQDIHDVTKLPLDAVRGRFLDDFSVDVRLSWAEGRETKREEDAAYSLLGIFDIYMPLIYGEGRQRAFRRLLKELNELRASEQPWYLSRSSTQTSQQAQDPGLSAPQPTSSVSEKIPVFEKYDPVDTTSQQGSIAHMPMWPGNFIRTKHSRAYLEQRDSLSNAAYEGRWSDVLELLELATEDYGENWSNAIRMSRMPVWFIMEIIADTTQKRHKKPADSPFGQSCIRLPTCELRST